MITRDERRWVLFFSVIVLTVTAVPYLLGYWRQNEAWIFSGFVFGSGDGNSYIAKMHRGASGDWLFRSPYSADAQPGLVAFLPYLLLGKLTAPPAQHEQLVALFQLFRVFSGGLLIYAVYLFASLFLDQIWQRRFATVLVVLGGGLGWLAPFGLQELLWDGRLPLEFYSPETFGFLAVFGLPHLAVARGLLLLGMLQYFAAYHKGTARPAIWAGVLWLTAGLFQPLTVATGWAVLGAFVVLAGVLAWFQQTRSAAGSQLARLARPALIAGLVSSPVVLYSFLTMLIDPYLLNWTAQNIILSPPPIDYLLAFFPVLLFVWIGGSRLVKQGKVEALLLIGWAAIFPLLAYAPHNLQRRLPEGIWVALSVLTAAGMGRSDGRELRWQMAVLATGLLSTLILVAGAGLAVWSPSVPLFHPASEAAAFRYLAENTPKDSVVLGSFDTSNRLPAWAPVRTITGHGPESVRARQIDPQIKAIFDLETQPTERQQILALLGVDYVIYGPAEREMGGWDPSTEESLSLVYQEADIKIFSFQGTAP